MDALKDFFRKDMIEQITILDEIRESGRQDAVSALMDLYVDPLPDQAVDEMVYHTLFELMAGQENATISGLRHTSPRVRMLSVRRAAEESFEAVKPVLLSLLESTDDADLIQEVIRGLRNYDDPSLAPVLLPYLDHEDCSVVAWAMNVLGDLEAPEYRQTLMQIVKDREAELRDASECDLKTALSVDNLAKFKDDDATALLMSLIHHTNPVFRRVVLGVLAAMGKDILPALEKCLETGDKDEKIMAANVIGLMGDKKGADILNGQLDQRDMEKNLRFAMYEALGRIPSIRSVIGLTDGLTETDEMVLLAVLTSLDTLCNPGVVKVVQEKIDQGDDQTARVIQALITSRATNLFKAVYESESHAGPLVEALLASKDMEAVEVFKKELGSMPGERPAADITRLSAGEEVVFAKRVVAADDSKAMLFFYKSAAAELGLELVTAMDGKEALDYFQTADAVDLLITDLNMPEMTGVELTQELRQIEKWADLPILMATTESESSQVDIAREAGVNDFISKPFTKDDFSKKVNEMLGS
ncbi:MAG: response regulator [Desulfobulbaceae bacterium]|nr:response regulator [Desulfobulbaceae bacterium]